MKTKNYFNLSLIAFLILFLFGSQLIGEPVFAKNFAKKVKKQKNSPSIVVEPVAKTNTEIDSFVYQLQKADFATILKQKVALVVVDPDDSGFSKKQVSELKNSGKRVLAYLSIGEAENWRAYWQKGWNKNPPAWLGEENPDWEDCFEVQYWNPEWKKIVFERIERMFELGYDGLYLDIVDGYEYWEKKGFSKAKEEMINFVKEISQLARSQKNSALIFPQNAVELLGRSDYLAVIDGVGAEETFYSNNRVASWSKWDIEWLNKAVKANKIVLTTDYSTKKELQCDFIKKAREHKFIPFVSVRNLDRIIQVNCD